MENYFQAEAFNLDKVLDEFEQNEGELLCQRGDGDKLRVTALEKRRAGRGVPRSVCRVVVMQFFKVSDNQPLPLEFLTNIYRW